LAEGVFIAMDVSVRQTLLPPNIESRASLTGRPAQTLGSASWRG
jgi:hypothetical protein